MHPVAALRVSAGQEKHGHRVGEGLGDAAEGVFGAGAVLGQKDAGFPAVHDAGEPVGHVHSGALLAADHRADAGDGGGLDERVGRHDANPFHAFHFQNVGNSGNSVHGGYPPSRVFAGVYWIGESADLGQEGVDGGVDLGGLFGHGEVAGLGHLDEL